MSYHDYRHYPRFEGWIQALARWERTKPWRGENASATRRPINGGVKRRHAHKCLIKHEDNSIGCILYSTEVIRYDPDGTIVLRPYASLLTNTYVNAILPANVSVYYNDRHCYVDVRKWQSPDGFDRKIYNVDEPTITLRKQEGKPEWDVTDAKPFFLYRLDKKKAQAALRQRDYFDFQSWLRVAPQMDQKRDPHVLRVSSPTLMEWLADREQWPKFLPLIGRRWRKDIETTLKLLRNEIYKQERCVTRTELPFVTTYKEIEQIYRGMKLYESLFAPDA